jgi:hypothetical protein
LPRPAAPQGNVAPPESQTDTAAVVQAINSSKTDLSPVVEAVKEQQQENYNAMQRFAAEIHDLKGQVREHAN